MPALQYYFAPFASSQAVHLLLEELELAFEPHPVALMAGENRSPEFLTLNPAGKVPVLVIDGQPLTETTAIIGWLSRHKPAAQLWPLIENSLTQARAQAVLGWLNSTVQPLITRINVPAAISREPAAYTGVMAAATEQLGRQLQIAESMLEGRQWLLGRWSAVDALLFWVWQAVGRQWGASEFPRIATHAGNVATRPATQRVLAREAAAIAQFVARGLPMPPGPQP